VFLVAGCSGSVERTDAGLVGHPPESPPVVDHVPTKVDILFDVDNSSSMADKERYLAAAIPDLLNRLIDPNCVDASGNSAGPSTNGTCPAGFWPELAPVNDLHLGIVSSSLGARGGDVCDATAMAQAPFGNVLADSDDQAHLLNRSLTYSADGSSVVQGTVGDAPVSAPYLYWFPAAPNAGKAPGAGAPISDPTTLVSDAADLVGGAGEFGCGIESQLESWYRFLIQPDPYESIGLKGSIGNGMGVWNGVDTTILRQRHDFLRPDSLVLVVVLSDENDSEIDVRSIGGLGVNWMAAVFSPPRGTTACASSPGSSACQSCVQNNSGATDPACTVGSTYSSATDWGYDLNLRHVHMKAKYGVDPQYPVERYLTGLASTVVPDRNGEYPPGATSYVGATDCQNPLYAASLPDGSQTDANTLCHSPPGSRTKDLVFYAHIGGVPSQLLHFTPGNATASALTDADWVKILGNDPETFDYSGIDPHMIESYEPRAGLAVPGSANDADPIDGHEWITNTGMGHILQVDLEYACTFPLVDSTGNPATRDCTQAQNAYGCACPHTAGSVTAEELPPVCDPMTQTLQVAAKAYPTVRELLLAHKMGSQGIVSSICPIHVADNATSDDPLYGYRPAVEGIVDRLKARFSTPCFTAPLTVQSDGTVECLILVQVPGGAAGTSGTCLDPRCPASAGLEVPGPQVLPSFCANLEAAYEQEVTLNGGSAVGLVDPASVPVCQLAQLSARANPGDFLGGSCAAGKDKGWCYVSGAAAGQCAQEIVFTPGTIPMGATSNLQCIESGTSVVVGGG
jgi:hypothetical protein